MYGLLQQTGALSLPLPAAIRRTATFSGNFGHRSSSRKLRFLLGLSFHRFSCPHSMRKPPTERLDVGTEGLDEDFMVNFESNSPVEICSTRILPPALTMSEAVERIREEMKTMKSELKTLASGVLRIQIALPPSLEPLNWLRSSKVFPQLYISATKMNEDIAFPNGLVEVVGIGAAVCLPGSSSKSDARKLSRYLSVDSPLISAYGFMGIHYDEKFSLLEHVCDSFYAIIPQIEVGKFKDCSFLALTLAWDRSELFFLDKAIFAAEQKLDQVIAGFPVMDNVCPESWGLPISELSNHAELKHINTVYMNGKHQERLAASGHDVQIEQLLADWRVHFRLTDSVTLATDRFEGFSKSPVFVSESANINALWATLIVEELVRLGLTYFCIAPGSRSSPLAISASTHRLTSCISCFDERSLAFHAVGYARGSSRPAVVITSSGTAVSNLLPAVVEASQDFLPMLLLTADRPPELHDCGANQAINQVLSLQPELITLVSL